MSGKECYMAYTPSGDFSEVAGKEEPLIENIVSISFDMVGRTPLFLCRR